MSHTDATPTQYRHYACRLCDWSSAAHPDPDGTGETPDIEDEYRKAWSHAETHGRRDPFVRMVGRPEHSARGIATVVTVRV